MVENSQIESSFAEIRKRNGDTTKFDQDKITNAIYKALLATSEGDRDLAQNLTNGVLGKLSSQGFGTENPPSVEDIQDMVESTLIEQGHSEIAKSYICLLYTSDAADDTPCVDLGGRRIIKKKK